MINWNQIDTVLLDMDGTLLDLHFDSYFWLEHLPMRFAEKNNLKVTEIKNLLVEQIMAEQGNLNWYSLDYWSNHFQLDIPALKEEIQHLIGFRADALNFLNQLKQTEYQVVLATNADQKSLDLKLPLTNLNKYVDTIYSSCTCGSPKEEQDYWHALQQLTKFNPETTLLIDDNETVLGAAQDFGIQHLITIRQPNSQKPKRETTQFPAIDFFAELDLHQK